MCPKVGKRTGGVQKRVKESWCRRITGGALGVCVGFHKPFSLEIFLELSSLESKKKKSASWKSVSSEKSIFSNFSQHSRRKLIYEGKELFFFYLVC